MIAQGGRSNERLKTTQSVFLFFSLLISFGFVLYYLDNNFPTYQQELKKIVIKFAFIDKNHIVWFII